MRALVEFHHYLPIPDSIFHSGLYVTSAGQATILPGAAYPPVPHPALYQFTWKEGRVLPEFSFVLITAGEGVFESEPTGKVTVTAGMVILLFPGIWHRYRPSAAQGWTEKWLQFNGEFAHRLLEQEVLSPRHAVLRLQHASAVETALDPLLTSVHEEPSHNSLRLSLQALQVLSAAMWAPPPATSSPRTTVPGDALVNAAVDYIWTRSHRVLAVTDVARAVGATRRTLERRFESVLGRSVLAEIIACRFSRAERLLRETELPIKSVAHLAGFGSAENMRQVFLRQTRFAPAHYRERAVKRGGL